MKRCHPQSIREVLEQVVEQCDLKEELLRRRAVAQWPNIVGPQLAAATGKPWTHGSVMMVAVHNAPLRNELAMHRTRMTAAINSLVGAKVISDIRFIGGNATQP